ncbi:GMC oxidoreductase [Arthrobacter sp.]|uniref:GMC family oxidoreductase n=1 Tax=Arthrobacter sp. TaxID=1667 RepID=UPI0028124D57|nr:GMC oxidoreductase [Arthrobacter sp.]
MTTVDAAEGPAEREYDYLVVGGGTAGCIVAARLAEDESVTVALAEWGGSDAEEPRANVIRRWDEMLEGEYDLDYRSVPQERGNSHIRLARMRILGGCSTANTMITWRPLRADLEEWVGLGASGWGPEALWPCYDRLATRISVIPEADRNPHLAEVVESASLALDLPVKERWNDHEFVDGAGFFEIGYDPATNQRSSTSYAYIHGRNIPNLDILHGYRGVQIELRDNRATGCVFTDASGRTVPLRARREVILACGAIDSPRLLQLSGIGPRRMLEHAGIDCRVDLPGVGENLMDHAEGLVVWETHEPVEETCATGWDAGYLVSVDDGPFPDISTHIPVHTWAVHAERMGARIPAANVSLAPNITKPKSRGRVWIESADPDAAPLIDYGYFTDPEGHDERMLVQGIRNARRVAEQEPLASRIVREVFPGPEVTTDEQISEIARQTHQTVYHVSGTCRIGAEDDDLAVLDPRLRVRGVTGLRVVDASVFPTITALNPVGTIMAVAERAAELIAEDNS